jgi:molybdopterin converting factor small subunit
MLLISQRLDEKGMAALGAENVRVAVNQALVAAPQTISPGDEVAFMPPVTGG